MRREFLLVMLAVGTDAGCRRRRPAALPLRVAENTPTPGPLVNANAHQGPVDPDELLPGNAVAFGLTMPVNTAVRFENEETRMYHVNAQMPRVMRYLQERLEFNVADIQPLGAMIHGARLREVDAAAVIDIGVRDEGERTLVTVWNRTPAQPGNERSMDDALRAAGLDPQTGLPIDPVLNR